MVTGMSPPPSAPPPGPEVQKDMIAEAMKLEMKQGQVWYVLGSKWWQLWKAYVRFDEQTPPAAAAATAPSPAAAAVATSRSPSNSSSMEEDGVLVKAEEDGLVVVAAEGGGESVTVKAENNEHRVAELSLDEGGGDGVSVTMKADQELAQRAGPGPINNQSLGEGRELREGMMEGEDYMLLHPRAYELLEAWYGGGPRFKRWVVSLGSTTHTQLTVELFPVKFMVYTCLPDGNADKASLKVQLYSRAKTMRQVCADVKASLNLTARVDTRLSLKKLEADTAQGTAGDAAPAGGGGGAEGEGDDGWQEIHLEEVSQLLHEVMGDTQTVALLVETKDTSDPNANTSFPRDHILLRWRLNLKVGDLIDARDSDKIWFESRVTEVDVDGDPEQIKVHFLGWSEKWDQVFKRSSGELQKLHTFTTPWRQDLQVTSKCEVSALRGDVKRWYEATVGEVKHENGQRLLFIEVTDQDVANQWMPEDSEEICKVNTHINKPQETRTISRARSGSGSGTGGGSYGFYRSNTKAKPLTRGAVGLSNLGNTCFMNSMLQCLLATESLSTYFRNQHWKTEVNEDNPLGMSGKMAAAYAGLNDDAWSGEYSVVVPNTVKKVVSQYAPMFAGYQQHDASELMSFLLDGIHEDLNRVHKKPYMETVDSAGRADLVVAEESWRRYLMRNDSIMVDTCTGLLRSHVTCPECKLSSVTFDPYTSLSLPLPVDTAAAVEVLFHPLPYGTKPIKIAVTLEKDNKVRALKTAICERYNAEFAGHAKKQQSGSGGGSGGGLLTEDHLAVMEVWSCRVFKTIEDSAPLSDMLNTKDEFVVCQLEFPLGAPGGSEKKAAGGGAAASAIPASPGSAAGFGSAGQSSWSGQTPSQGTGEADVEGGKRGGTGGASVLIDLVLATHPSSTLKGRPVRITCRHGVTNNEIHSIVRRHVSRFVPSLKAAPKHKAAGNEGGGMAKGEQGTQEAGISTTSDIDGDYVHVNADPVALDSSSSSGGNTNSPGGGSTTTSSNGDASPFVHVKKSPAVVVSDGDEPAAAGAAAALTAAGAGATPSAADMDVEEIWNDISGAANAAGGVSGVAAGAAAVVSSDADKGVGGGEAAEAETVTTGGGDVGKGKGKGKEAEGAELPYVVLKSDYAGSISTITKPEIPMNDEPLEVGPPTRGHGYSTMRTNSRESTTIKIQFLEHPGRRPYDPHSLIDVEEMDASDTHPSAKEAQEAQKKRQSVPIDNCFEKFTECEQLGTSELWYCSRCKTHRQAYKKLDVYTAPDVLIVVLKRFLFDTHTGNSMVYRQKLDTHVSFPIEGLDLTSNIQRAGGPISEEAPPIYDLFAVSEHSGSLRAGHYTAIAQNFEDKKWYSFNDSQVSPTTPDQGPSSEPYVLFYRRRKGVLRWAGMGRDHAA